MQIQLPGRRSLGLQGGIDKRNLCVTDARGVRWGVWMIQEIPNINWLAVLVAAILRIVVGSVWFSPVAFVKPWQQLTGVTPDSMQRGLARAIIVDFILSLVMKFATPDFPFMNRMLVTFFVTLALAVVMSLVWPNAADRNRIDTANVDYKTSTGFNAAAAAVCMILIALYATWW